LAPYQIVVLQGNHQPFVLCVIEEMVIADVQLKEQKDLNPRGSLSASGTWENLLLDRKNSVTRQI